MAIFVVYGLKDNPFFVTCVAYRGTNRLLALIGTSVGGVPRRGILPVLALRPLKIPTKMVIVCLPPWLRLPVWMLLHPLLLRPSASHSAGPSEDSDLTLSSSPVASAEEQTVEGDGGISPFPPAVENISGSVSADSLESSSGVSLDPAPVEASPSGDSRDVNARDNYAFTCGQAMPDSQSSQIVDSPMNDGPVGQNVVVLEDGQASGQIPDPNHASCNESEIAGSRALSGDPSDSVPSREVSPSDVASVLRMTRLGRIFKRTAPYPKKGVVHMSPVVSDRPGRGERTKR